MRPLMLVAYARRNNPHTITPDELELINPDTPTPQPQNHAQTPAETTKKPATDTSPQPLQRATSAELAALPPISVPCSTNSSSNSRTPPTAQASFAAVVSSFNRLDGTLFYANVGHPPPLAWNPTPAGKNLHRIESLGPANLPLGIKANTQYDQACQTLAPGDRLFLYSDGITECPIPTGDFFDEDRLLNDSKNEDLHILKQNLKQSLEAFSGGPLLHDDCTFLCFEVLN